ncbi:MAG: 50S ribosomal protein L30e [Candidatus Helarchaeota archaeon]
MIDEDTAIKIALKTGKVIIGSKRTIKSLISNKVKMIIKASNCPIELSEELKHYSNLANIKLHTYKGSSLDLGFVCGKPFMISTIAIEDAGDSDILKFPD